MNIDTMTERFPWPPTRSGGGVPRRPLRGARRSGLERPRLGPAAGRAAALALVILGMMGGRVVAGQAADTNTPARKIRTERETRQLAQFFRTCFEQWHHGPGGVLSIEEVNAVIANPRARGNEAAAAVLIRWTTSAGGRQGTNGMSLEELQGLAADPQARHRFFQIRDHIWNVNRTVDRTLFLGQDPNFLSFHQGKIQDCYFLAVVGCVVCRDPQRVRLMIADGDGGYRVGFPGGGNVSVPFLTDAEMVMGASVGSDHGIWLSVLEKAYGLLRKQRWGNRQRESQHPDPGAGSEGSADGGSATIADIMGHGGASGPVIALFTGHRAGMAPLDHWLQEDSPNATNRLHQLLVEMARGKRLMTISGAGYNASTPVPKGIIPNHVFGVLGYRAEQKVVILFNPWGNYFNPKGMPGPVNGYPTRHGVFEVPLQDVIRIFAHLDYETAEPLGRRI